MIYLDNAATSWPKAPLVSDAMKEAIDNPYGNIGRSAHELSQNSSSALYKFRSLLHSILPPTKEENIIVTSGATHSLNIALLGSIKPHDTIITTQLEHNAVMRVLDYLKKDNIQVIPLKSDSYGRVLLEEIQETIANHRPKLAVINGASNVNGVVQPLEELINVFNAHHIPLIIDASQLMGEVDLPQNIKDISGAVCFSLHKGLLGPSGVGAMALYGAFLPTPLIFGGTGSKSDSIIQPTFLPDRYESGTLPIPAIIGSNSALEYVISHKGEIYTTKYEMAEYLYNSLVNIKEIRMLSPKGEKVPNITFTVKKGTISSLSQFLFNSDIAFRSGFHCAPSAHTYLNTHECGGAIRFSIGYTTTRGELDEVIDTVKRGIDETRR
ncbi:MAG: aminotransferase class V-fold PLP-dependent enzyme [Spirochaetia bacterium]|nr:aminotransferase class V-fold PLP-dependent enzyme [Spirochaetia bacterium]